MDFIKKNRWKLIFIVIGLIYAASHGLYERQPGYWKVLVIFTPGIVIDWLMWGNSGGSLSKLRPNKRNIFIQTFFHSCGVIAKADGNVSVLENNVAMNFMKELELSEGDFILAQHAFESAQVENFLLEEKLSNFYKEFRSERVLREQFIDLLLKASIAGDERTDKVNSVLLSIGSQIGVSRQKLTQLLHTMNKELIEIYYRNRKR